MNTVHAVLADELQRKMGEALAMRHPKYKLMWRIGVETGLRISDILRLKARHFRGNGEYAIIERKTKKRRVLSVSEGLLKEIKGYKRTFGLKDKHYLIFSSADRVDKPLSRQQAYNVIRAAGAELGLAALGTHSMRKTYAVNVFSQCGRVDVLQERLNHCYLSTTLLYLQDILNVFIK